MTILPHVLDLGDLVVLGLELGEVRVVPPPVPVAPGQDRLSAVPVAASPAAARTVPVPPGGARPPRPVAALGAPPSPSEAARLGVRGVGVRGRDAPERVEAEPIESDPLVEAAVVLVVV
ncbi:hypothetical protein THAOC_26980, partial [Thalassiosira oceanica]